jgi:hypothetical protein
MMRMNPFVAENIPVRYTGVSADWIPLHLWTGLAGSYAKGVNEVEIRLVTYETELYSLLLIAITYFRATFVNQSF